MTEDEAKAWLEYELSVSRETMAKLAKFIEFLVAESANQNLISADSEDRVWARHIVDSAQLLALDNRRAGRWVDLGTGAGFPGVVLAILRNQPITFVEPRRRRVEFLQTVTDRLNLSHVDIRQSKIETLKQSRFDVITARAFANLSKTFQSAHRVAHQNTVWLLPKGRSAQSELESVRGSWQGVFHVKQSVTDPEAGIIVATDVRSVGTK